jgi:hypothetical protein
MVGLSAFVFLESSELSFLAPVSRHSQTLHSFIFQVIETEEELRLELSRTFDCLLRGILAGGAERTLDAYYAEIIFSIQPNLLDSFPNLNIEACNLLVQLLRIPHWEQGSKYFATGLARSALLGCRQRNTNVIIASIALFEASVCVPDRAKKKGAGTAAIADLVGFREENVSGVRYFMALVYCQSSTCVCTDASLP